MKGRPTKFGTRLKPNGLTNEMEQWLQQEADRRKITRTELKRIALAEFRQRVEAELSKAPEY